ncbi:MAG TPA: 3' terminal RNA ribose 2'-O-methyltransferase Hen1 [Planctomycetaceae bacterium]|jgi:3' terminal RNA ribose 2'-O-methyltransferase Hen1|nr:3' terminal RNA ribose 2'-O-methyltransferase Hen1 [Planctomycetaceae bacterium]
MLLTITTTKPSASDLGYLLHKHPDRFQSFDLSFGRAHVFYPESSEDRCTACLMLDVDPVGMVRRKHRNQSFLLGHYVNDRPYVASSFMSVAISQVFGTALSGRCKDRPELVTTPIPLVVRIETLPVRGGEELLHRVFDPLGYEVQATRHALDSQFPEWGESPYFSVTLAATKTLSELLAHLYVLIPVFDNEKHYFVGEDELEKLLVKGTGWLASHPEKEQITRRYLRHRSSLYREALARLADVEETPIESDDEIVGEKPEDLLEQPLSLNEERHGAVLAALRACGARSVLDLGCGEGKLLQELLRDRQFERILGMDVSVQALERAVRRLNYDRLPPKQRERIDLIHGSLIYRDKRLSGFDAAAVVEVIEHLDPPRLSALQRVLFEFARPKTVVLTTPNSEYNVKWETLPAGEFRHPDHRFEWTRSEFQAWGARMAERHDYKVRFLPIGPVDETLGAPTQMGVFERE